jgi:multiple sugar transport system ATP-binding protein
VAIGRAIVRKPKVFLFDEPLSNLDAALRVNMRIELSRLHKELGATMIYVTHDQVEAMTMGDRIAVFHQGIVEQLGAPMDLYNRPANEFVAGFIGAPRINLVDRPAAAAPAAHRALWQALAADAPAGVRRVGLRAEHLRVVSAGEGVPANVELAEHLGDVSILHLRVDGVADLLNAKIGAGHARVDAGQTVGLVPDKAWALGFGADSRLAA